MAMPVSWVLRVRKGIRLVQKSRGFNYNYAGVRCYSQAEEVPKEEEEFRVLQIKPKPRMIENKRKEIRVTMPPPRANVMPTDQDWSSVWPGPRTFHPASVPLPVRQGVNKHGPAPQKFGNAELMKIPNFLHLAPPAIEKHCNAIKKFCTPWPEELDTDEDMEAHFPIEVITHDYCHSSPTIRDPLARIVSIKVKLRNLQFDDHARDKFLRLVEDRYDPATDYVTITTDSCPLKKQNYDYAQYLLTALVYESWKKEPWESEKCDEDMEVYVFSKRQSYKNVEHLFGYTNKEVPDTKKFGQAVEDWHNQGDSPENIEKYKEAAMKLLSLPKF